MDQRAAASTGSTHFATCTLRQASCTELAANPSSDCRAGSDRRRLFCASLGRTGHSFGLVTPLCPPRCFFLSPLGGAGLTLSCLDLLAAGICHLGHERLSSFVVHVRECTPAMDAARGIPRTPQCPAAFELRGMFARRIWARCSACGAAKFTRATHPVQWRVVAILFLVYLTC